VGQPHRRAVPLITPEGPPSTQVGRESAHRKVPKADAWSLPGVERGACSGSLFPLAPYALGRPASDVRQVRPLKVPDERRLQIRLRQRMSSPRRRRRQHAEQGRAFRREPSEFQKKPNRAAITGNRSFLGTRVQESVVWCWAGSAKPVSAAPGRWAGCSRSRLRPTTWSACRSCWVPWRNNIRRLPRDCRAAECWQGRTAETSISTLKRYSSTWPGNTRDFGALPQPVKVGHPGRVNKAVPAGWIRRDRECAFRNAMKGGEHGKARR
jgi:hypothetical protein